MRWQQSCLCTILVLAANLVIAEFQSTELLAQSGGQPNIVLINLDDADLEMFDRSRTNLGSANLNLDGEFPSIMAIANQGISFTNMHVTTPLCGPSRACLYTSLYAHRSKIKANFSVGVNRHGYQGDFDEYVKLGHHENDLSKWMHDVNYRTMMVGKYIHPKGGVYVIPDSWDDFYHCHGDSYFGTYVYSNADQPEPGTAWANKLNNASINNFDNIPEYGAAFNLAAGPTGGYYRTNFERDVCLELIDRHVGRNNGQPFFLNVNPYGPHTGNNSDPAINHLPIFHPAFADSFSNSSQPANAAIDELMLYGVAGYAQQPPFSNPSNTNLERAVPANHFVDQYRERMRTIKSVNYLVGSIGIKLAEHGLDGNTYIMLTSDNGYSLGHHRTLGKGTPTNRSSKVPFFVSGPGVQVQNETVGHLLGHIDIAATIADLGGALTTEIQADIDGKSFVSLINSNNPRAAVPTRNELLIENWETLDCPDRVTSNGAETADWASTTLRLNFPSMPIDHETGRSDFLYTEWANGDRDFFFLPHSPDQLTNTAMFLLDITAEYFHDRMAGMRFQGNANVPPEVHFTSPLVGPLAGTIDDDLQVTGDELFGYAEDPVGVQEVRYLIYNAATGNTWNADQLNWSGNTSTQHQAVLENPDGFITRWKVATPTAETSSDNLFIFVWAYDAQSNFTIEHTRFVL